MTTTDQRIITSLPGWALDIVVTAAMIVVAVVLERATAGRLSTTNVVLIVGIFYFVLLRFGAVFARIGRTFGCGFAFLITWLLPCGIVGWLTVSTSRQMMVRDSLPLFILLGAYLIVVMGITFERTRIHDTARLAEQGTISDEAQ